MPIYKGAVEVTSGNLFKGSTEIENGYKGADSFYINETTVSWATPTGDGLIYSIPAPQSSSGSPGASFPSTTFTVTTSGNKRITSVASSITGLPSTLTASTGSLTSGINNSYTVTISGTFPTTSSLNTAVITTGNSTIQYYSLSINYSAMGTGSGATPLTRGVSVTGALSTSANSGIWTGYLPPGATNVYLNYSCVQQNAGNQTVLGSNYWLQTVPENGIWGGSIPGISGLSFSPYTQGANIAGRIQIYNPDFNSTASYTMPSSNTSLTMTGGITSMQTQNYGYGITAIHSGASSTAIFLSVQDYSGKGWTAGGSRFAILTSNNGSVLLSYFTQSGGSNYKVRAVGTIAQNDYPQQMQQTTTASAGNTFTASFSFGGYGYGTVNSTINIT